MNERIIDLTTKIIIIRKSVIGLQYRPMNNSDILLYDTNVRGRLYGCVTEIISEPFMGIVPSSWDNRFCKNRLCVKVRSLDSGLIYQVPFYEEHIVETTKLLHETIIGRTLKINDNSYATRLATDKHVSLFRQCMTIISKPYLWFDTEYKHKHLMVDVVDENGHTYRVLFNEDGLIDKFNLTFCP